MKPSDRPPDEILGTVRATSQAEYIISRRDFGHKTAIGIRVKVRGVPGLAVFLDENVLPEVLEILHRVAYPQETE